MAGMKREVIVDVPIEEVFEFVSHTPSLAEVWPSLLAVTNWSRDEQGLATFDYVYMMAGVRMRGKNRDREFIPNNKIVTESMGGIDSLITWEFEPRDKQTYVKLTAEYNIPVPVLGWVAERIIISMNNLDLDMLMKNLKSRLEGAHRLSSLRKQ
jgi:hypothetical protein